MKYLIPLIILTTLLVGGVFVWQYFGVTAEKTEVSEELTEEAQEAKLISLEIIPSQKTEKGIVYPEGAKAIAIGKNLARVEFRQRGGGTEIYTSPEGGLVGIGKKIEVKEGKEKYETLLPSKRLMREFCVLGFDQKERKIGEICLFNVRGIGKKKEKPEQPYLEGLYNIELLSPNGGERWEEENSYTIKWEQKDLTKWGNKITICLIGFDVNGKAISAKEDWGSPACAYAVSSDGVASYLIDKTTLSAKKYNWRIPKDISERFEIPPYNFKIALLIFDELPPNGKTEWGGLMAQDESDNYFDIWRSYKNIEYRFELKYPQNWALTVYDKLLYIKT